MQIYGDARRGNSRTITKILAGIGAGALLLKGVRLGKEVFGPVRSSRMEKDSQASPATEEFAGRLACVVDGLTYRDTSITVLKNGEEFYPAELASISEARESINLEAYEFLTGEVTGEFVARLTERARAGVQVRLLIDAIGSWKTSRSFFDSLTAAGGHVVRYHPLDWRDWQYYDHRTHRKLLIVDGRVGFIGGADVADHWLLETKGKPRWRDTVFHLEGGAARSLNATFAQNWVASTGELLFSPAQFPASEHGPGPECMVVMSTPGYGTSRARVLFESLIEAAEAEIMITSPYFLPGHSTSQSLIRAVRERGVRVRVLTAGASTDHNSIRRLSEAMSVKLIRAGVEYYEYQPGMIHAKLMTIDGRWTVGGSTNFDHRSFALNDEVNLVIRGAEVAATIDRQFAEDLAQSRRMSLRRMKSGGLGAEFIENASWVLRREE